MASKEILKQKLRGLNYQQSAIWVLNKLAFVEKKGIVNAPEWAPWYLLLFLRYCAKFSAKRQSGNEQDIATVYAYYDQYIKEQHDPFLNDGRADVSKFFLRLSHQQFVFQNTLTGLKYKLARQCLFFSCFDGFFKNKLGITSEIFLKFSFLLFSLFSKDERFFTLGFFDSLDDTSQDLANNYLGLISANLSDLRNDSLQSIRFEDREIFDYSFFRSRPLLRIENRYFVFSESLFRDFLGYGLYDVIKADRALAREFGRIFHKYAEERILSACPQCLTEDVLKARLPRHGDEPKIIDAILPLSNITLLFEYKASELFEGVRLLPSDKSFRTQYNLIKAIAQAYGSLDFIEKNANLFPEIDSQKPKFLLVISYKETYLGTACRHWGNFEPELRTKYNIQDVSRIDPQNIFFVSIDDLDWFLSLGSKMEETILTAKDRFGRNDAHSFSQVLAKFVDRSFKMPALDKVFDEICLKCIGGIRGVRENISS